MSNGMIDTSTLTMVPGQSSLRLTAAAAASWGRLRAAVQAAHGWTPTLTDAYRDYATQERIFRERYTSTYLSGRPTKRWNGATWYLRSRRATAATPGTSNHGLGTTVDITGLGGFNGARYRELAAIAGSHGWNNIEGRSISEAWHWTHVPTSDEQLTSAGGTTTGTVTDVPASTAPTPLAQEDDDMQLFIGIVTNGLANTDAEFGSTFVIDPIAGFVQTSKGLGSRADLDGYRALAGLQGWKIVEKVTDKNALVMSKTRYVR